MDEDVERSPAGLPGQGSLRGPQGPLGPQAAQGSLRRQPRSTFDANTRYMARLSVIDWRRGKRMTRYGKGSMKLLYNMASPDPSFDGPQLRPRSG